MPTRNKLRSKKHIKTKKQKRSKKYIAKKKKYLRKTRRVFRGGAAMPVIGRNPLSDPFVPFTQRPQINFTDEYPTMDARFDFLHRLKKRTVTDEIHNCICNILFYLANVEKFAIVNGNSGQTQGVASLDRSMFQLNKADQIANNAAYILKTSRFIDNITQQQNVNPYRPVAQDPKNTQYFVLRTGADERIVWETTPIKPTYDAAHIIQIKFISVFLNYLKILIPRAKDCLEWLDTHASVIYTDRTVNRHHEMFLRSGSIVFWMIMYVLIYNLGDDCIELICESLTDDMFQEIMASTAILDAYTKKLLGQLEGPTDAVIRPNLIESVMIASGLKSIHDMQRFMSGARGDDEVLRKASADILALSLLFDSVELPNIFRHTLELWRFVKAKGSDLDTMFVLTGRAEAFNTTLVDSPTGHAHSLLYYRKRALETFIGLVDSPGVDKVSQKAAERIGLVSQLSTELYEDHTKSFEEIMVDSKNALVKQFMDKFRRAQMRRQPDSPRPFGKPSGQVDPIYGRPLTNKEWGPIRNAQERAAAEQKKSTSFWSDAATMPAPVRPAPVRPAPAMPAPARPLVPAFMPTAAAMPTATVMPAAAGWPTATAIPTATAMPAARVFLTNQEENALWQDEVDAEDLLQAQKALEKFNADYQAAQQAAEQAEQQRKAKAEAARQSLLNQVKRSQQRMQQSQERRSQQSQQQSQQSQQQSQQSQQQSQQQNPKQNLNPKNTKSRRNKAKNNRDAQKGIALAERRRGEIEMSQHPE
jgi:hypothetical protein